MENTVEKQIRSQKRPSPVYKNLPDVLVVANQCLIPKRRIVGMFSIRIRRIKQLLDKMVDEGKIIDVTARLAAKTLIILDTGQGVLTGFTVRSLAQYCGETGITGTDVD